MAIKCLDTYVLWEYVTGNEKYKNYFEKDFIIPELTLAEFYGVLLREFNEKTALYWVEQFQSYSESCSLHIFLSAIQFKQKYSKQNISFFDAIGYMFAQEQGIPFVTGDKEFRDLTGVEFVPK